MFTLTWKGIVLQHNIEYNARRPVIHANLYRLLSNVIPAKPRIVCTVPVKVHLPPCLSI
jgi:hypothetical protein